MIFGTARTETIERIQSQAPTPAHALFDFWYAMIDGACEIVDERPTGITFGARGGQHMWLSWNGDQPIITFGAFQVTSEGLFRISRIRGHKGRDVLAENTFLDWTVYGSEIVWFVKATRAGFMTPSHRAAMLRDWRYPVHYVSANVLCPTIGPMDRNPWSKLRRGADGRWEIVWARDSQAPTNSYVLAYKPRTREHYRAYERIRQRRLRQLEREWRIEHDLLDDPRTEPFSSEELIAREQHRVEIAVAAFEVSAPAKRKRRNIPTPVETEEVSA